MSFILDALKKSESERHRAAVPGLAATTIVRRESRLPMVLAIVATLLLLNVGILFFLLRRESPPVVPPPAADVRTHPTAAANGAPAGPAPAIPGSASPAPARLSAPVRPLGAEPAPAENARADLEPPPVGERVIRPPARESASSAERSARSAPSDLPAGLAALPQPAGLPPLNVDLHVYASAPGARFAVINGHRYHEGDSLAEGPRVETITPDGVILNFHGSRFLLRRQ